MRIQSLVALLCAVGTASASSVTGSYSTPTNDFFMLDTSYYFSLGYSTNFDSGKDSTNTDILYHSYELNLKSDISLTYEITILSTYQDGGQIHYGPCLITPYRQFIKWINPLAVLAGNSAFDVGFTAEYDLYFGQLSYINNIAAQEYSFDIASWLQDMILGTETFAGLVPSLTDFAMSYPSSFMSDYILYDTNDGLDAAGTWTGTQTLWQTSFAGLIA